MLLTLCCLSHCVLVFQLQLHAVALDCFSLLSTQEGLGGNLDVIPLGVLLLF